MKKVKKNFNIASEHDVFFEGQLCSYQEVHSIFKHYENKALNKTEVRAAFAVLGLLLDDKEFEKMFASKFGQMESVSEEMFMSKMSTKSESMWRKGKEYKQTTSEGDSVNKWSQVEDKVNNKGTLNLWNLFVFIWELYAWLDLTLFK